MSLESAKAKWRQNAQEKVNEMHEAHDIHLAESRRRGREAIAGGVALTLTGIANIVDAVVDYVPAQWHPYSRGASVVSGVVAVSGWTGFKYSADRAASKARVAIAYALPNEIALPEWTHPYIERNQDLFEQDLALAKSAELPS